jgi:hypothetical protein
MAEGQTQAMTLEDVESTIFGYFQHWLYTQETSPKNVQLRLIDCAKFFSIADRFMVSTLKKPLKTGIKAVEPSSDLQSGNTLKDFQHFAYGEGGGNFLQTRAISRTKKKLARENIKNLIDDFPVGMLENFAISVSEDLVDQREAVAERKAMVDEIIDIFEF